MDWKKNINMSLKIFIVGLIFAMMIGGSILYVGVKSLEWGVEKYQVWKETKSIDFSQRLKNIFAEKEPRDVQKVKIIDEQSQVIEVVKKASPAVVSIVATAEIPTFENYFDVPSGIPQGFEQFFGIPRRRQSGTEEQKVGAGTGFLVSSDGYIITNKHVVNDKEADYTVYLNDAKSDEGEKIKAKIIAIDPKNDLAVLKIEKKNLPFLEFSDSSTLQVGQTVITIGYALGEFDNTVSKGVISGLSRSITAGGGFTRSETLRNLIQTDAAINPGNSGGPMLDIEGNVIGVNVAMASAENIGFALLGNEAKDVFEQVKNTGNIQSKETPFLGVRYFILNAQIAEKNKLPYEYGALVTRGEERTDIAVMSGSPADRAGIVENDIILEVDGKKVTERNPLADLIASYKTGDEVTLKVYHKSEEKELKVILGKSK